MRVRPVSPSPGHIWISGNYVWRGGQYIYNDGYWAALSQFLNGWTDAGNTAAADGFEYRVTGEGFSAISFNGEDQQIQPAAAAGDFQHW